MQDGWTLFALDAEHFEALKKKRHLRRLVDVLVERKAPAEIGLAGDTHLDALHLGTSWSAFDTLLSNISSARHGYYLKEIEHRTRLAGYWRPHEIDWSLDSFGRLAVSIFEALRQSHEALRPCEQFTYMDRGRTQWSSGRLVPWTDLRAKRSILVETLARRSLGTLGDQAEEVAHAYWETIAFMTDALGANLPGGRDHALRALVLVRHPPTETEKARGKNTARLTVEDARRIWGPRPAIDTARLEREPPEPAPKPRTERAPPSPARGLFDPADPAQVVAYLQRCARHQILDNPGQHHTADHVQGLYRQGAPDAERVQAAIHSACIELVRVETTPAILELVHYLTRGKVPREFHLALLTRLENDDLPPPASMPLELDLRGSCLGSAVCREVANDSELRGRYRALLKRAKRVDLLLEQSLQADPEGELVEMLAVAPPESLDAWAIRRIVGTLNVEPDVLLAAAGAFARAAEEVREEFRAQVAQHRAEWYEEHEAELKSALGL